MKHKWMTLLVVIVTTMATAHEAFKQYDGLKAQAEGWATLRLWTGLLNTYEPQEEEATLVVACSVNQMKGEESGPQEFATPAATIAIQNSESHKRDETVSFTPPVLVSASEVEHHNDAAVTEALERNREVALMTDTDNEPEAEEPIQHDAETEPVGAPDDETESGAGLRVVREVRFISRAAKLVEAEAASPLSDVDSDGEATENARTAARAKAKAMRRALKALQFHLDRAAEEGLRDGLRGAKVEPVKIIETVSRAVNDPGLIAAVSTPTPQAAAVGPLNTTGIGGCASE